MHQLRYRKNYFLQVGIKDIYLNHCVYRYAWMIDTDTWASNRAPPYQQKRNPERTVNAPFFKKKKKKERRKITQKNVLTITYLRIKQVATSKIDRLLSNSGSWLEQWSRMSEEETWKETDPKSLVIFTSSSSFKEGDEYSHNWTGASIYIYRRPVNNNDHGSERIREETLKKKKNSECTYDKAR